VLSLVDVPIINPTDTVCGKMYFLQSKSNNKFIERRLEVFIFEGGCQTGLSLLMTLIGNMLGCFVTNKVKEIPFRIFHKFYPVKHFLSKFRKDIDVNCSFCTK